MEGTPHLSTHRRIARTILASVGLLGAAASIAGLTTYATFTDSTTASQSISTGVVNIDLGTANTADNRLTVAATGVHPGDTMQRAVKLSNTSTATMGSITLTTSATTSTALDTDATNGLQMAIDRCSVAWTESGTSPAYTYTCGGSTSTVLATRAIIGSDLALSNVGLTSGSVDYLRVTVTLPSTAGNSFQGLSSTVQYSFTGTQRSALAA
ncbi:MAG: TasA family protein [Microthrixaceae bacterium]